MSWLRHVADSSRIPVVREFMNGSSIQLGRTFLDPLRPHGYQAGIELSAHG
jgi:hypothetical protein